MPQVTIDDGLFIEGPEGTTLRGSRCSKCSIVTFPTQTGCPACHHDEMIDVPLPTRGTLWTFTTQGFPPKAAPEGSYIGPLDPFEPFTVGYVELEGHCKVESRLTEPDPAKLRIGMEMQLVMIPIDGDVMTFAFEPVPADD